jgi:dUTP pyrophosphatase
MKIKVINNSQHSLPTYATDGSSGLDLCASFTSLDQEFKGNHFEVFNEKEVYIVLYPGGRVLIPTDLFVEIPKGYELQIRCRSGLAIKNGISMVNCVGTIDSDYRGNIGIILINHDLHTPFVIKNGDRIAQAILNKCEKIEWNQVLKLEDSNRGTGGFGSTGK